MLCRFTGSLKTYLFTVLEGIVCGFKYNETVQSKTLLNDSKLACESENENLLVCVLTKLIL